MPSYSHSESPVEVDREASTRATPQFDGSSFRDGTEGTATAGKGAAETAGMDCEEKGIPLSFMFSAKEALRAATAAAAAAISLAAVAAAMPVEPPIIGSSRPHPNNSGIAGAIVAASEEPREKDADECGDGMKPDSGDAGIEKEETRFGEWSEDDGEESGSGIIALESASGGGGGDDDDDDDDDDR